MQPKKSWIHLERAEVLAVFIVLLLSHGLLYVLGLLTGFGLGPTHETKEVAAVEAKGSHHRSPAAVEHAGDESDGEAAPLLRKAYKESKQQAMNELALRKNSMVGKHPKSVEASEAHFGSHSEWSRQPAALSDSAEPIQAGAASDSAAMAKKVKAAESASPVKSLFERKPASFESFSPRIGTYAVQIASYATSDEAQAKVSELRKAGYNEAFIQNALNKGGSEWFRVAVGAFPNKEWAKKAGEKIVKRRLAHDFIVREIQ